MRFKSDTVRLASSICFLLGTVPYMGVVLYGPSLALSSVTPLSVTTSIFIVGSICTFYTSIGGIRAVVWTDCLQVALMYSGLLAVMLRGFYLVGGIGEAFKIAYERGRIEFFNVGFDPTATNNFWNAVLGMGLVWCGNYCTTQTEVQRYCNVTSEKKAKLAIYANLIGVVSIISLACLCGIALFAYYANCDPLKAGLIERKDQLMPYFVVETLSEFKGLPGLFVSCVFSASLSTLSSGFNALSAVTWDDFLSHTRFGQMSETKIKLVNKFTALFYGVLSICMAFLVGQIDSVLKAAISLVGCLVGPLFAMYLLALICPFATVKGVLTGLFSGVAFGFWILIGSLIYPGSDIGKETSIEHCLFKPNVTDIEPRVYDSNFVKLYHIAFLLVPVSGFIVSISLGFVTSLLTNGSQAIKTAEPRYMSPYIWKIWPSKFLPPRSTHREVIEIPTYEKSADPSET